MPPLTQQSLEQSERQGNQPDGHEQITTMHLGGAHKARDATATTVSAIQNEPTVMDKNCTYSMVRRFSTVKPQAELSVLPTCDTGGTSKCPRAKVPKSAASIPRRLGALRTHFMSFYAVGHWARASNITVLDGIGNRWP